MIYDLLVVGGGVNGCAIARDAAGRGLSVLLVEQGDLANATSSASSKLVHGGLRYLELYEFRLVREALAEREVMLEAAPHIIWPLTFVLPHGPGSRPAWLLRLGLFLYDHLARRKRLPASHAVRLSGTPLGAPLRADLARGFTYADCWVEDSRLVILNALDAKERGADIRTRTTFLGATREPSHWRVSLEGGETIAATALVNAAGPWVSHVLSDALTLEAHKHVRLVKGSHVVTRKLYDGDQAYVLQNPDKRIVFVIPYERDFTLIGTTDVAHDATPERPAIDEAEIAYLLESVNRSFRRKVERSDIVWSYSGLRPLFDDGSLNASVVTRDYAFDLDASGAPALSVFGGKITTARRLAEHAMSELARFFPQAGGAWTASAPLPGGDMPHADFEAFLDELSREKPFLPPRLAYRLARAYGTRVHALLGDARSMDDLGRDFGEGLTDAEIGYLRRVEFARTAEDILWRRSKLGLHLDPERQAQVAAAIEA